MLTKLLPDQIAKFWDIIKYALDESLPLIVIRNNDTMNNILASLLNGSLQCWVSYEKSEEKGTINGLIITTIAIDFASKTKNLLVYAAYAYKNNDLSVWKTGYETLAKWAKFRNCSNITAYSDNLRVIKLAKLLSGDVSQTFISIPIASFKI